MKIFVSYSRNDLTLFQEFIDGLAGVHFLVPPKSVWHDELIPPGSEWDKEIRVALKSADLVVMLVSRNFMRSEYIWKKEMLPALARHEAKQCKVLPIILRPTAAWEKSPLGKLQAAFGGEPVAGPVNRRDKAWKDIIEDIVDLAEEFSCAASPLYTPASIIAAPADFQGRAREIKKLADALLQPGGGTAAITALKGMGGIGKTTLAKYVANLPEIRARFPGPLILVDMQGQSAAPLTPAAALLEAARAADQNIPATDDIGQAATLFRKALTDAQALTLLDNAPKDADLRRALPPPGCGLIVTSRAPTQTPDGVKTLALGLLSPSESADLLQAVANRADISAAEWERIAQACGRLPLALRVAGAYLARYDDVSASDYLADLRDARRRRKVLRLGSDPEKDVLAVLGRSVKRLADEDAALAARWRLLAVFPGDFDRKAAAAAWDCEEPATRDALRKLLDQALLLHDQETRRYKLHDLLRDVAMEGVANSDLDAAALRHARYFVEVLREAERLYRAGHDNVLAGLHLFDLEAHNIVSAMEWAMMWADRDEAAARMANALPEAGSRVLSLRLSPDTRITWRQSAASAARRLSDQTTEGAHLGDLGVALLHKGDLDEAFKYQNMRLQIALKQNDRQGEAYAICNIANIYDEKKEHQNAIVRFENALNIFNEIKDFRAEGMVMCNIGISYQSMKEHDKALYYYKISLDIATSPHVGDRRGAANAYWCMADLHACLNQMGEAVVKADKAVKIFEAIKDPYTETARAFIAEWRAKLREADSGDRDK